MEPTLVQYVEVVPINTIGALSNRVTNPLCPNYHFLGETQRNQRQDCIYAEEAKEKPKAKAATRYAPQWEKSTVIPIIMDKPTNKIPVQQSNAFTSAANV